MGVYKLSTAGGLATPRTNYSSFLAGNPAVEFSSYFQIATTTVGSGGTATITFSSIPATYTHLQIRGICKTDRADDNDLVKMRFNSDTGSNYSQHYLLGSGSAASTGGSASASSIMTISGAGNNVANAFGVGVIDILDYKDTNKYKSVRTLGGYETNSTGFVSLYTGAWFSTSAITSIQLSPNIGSNFNQYSQFALYGIKGA
jgi:hypothetical protein